MTINTINYFSQINIIPNSLVVLDIDETLIKFENIDNLWWNREFTQIYEKNNDYDLTEEIVYSKWLSIVSNSNPILVDDFIHIFLEKCEQNNCKIILLTARNNCLFDLTLSHLKRVNLYFSHIYFNENKGDELNKIISNELKKYNDIIVVDDLVKNLNDIKNKIISVNLHLYNIKIK